jgi:hypothetical protein
MENIGLGEKGHGVMSVEDCNNAHINRGSVAMEAIMDSIRQPSPSSFSFRDISWWVELRQTPQHHTKKLMVWKRLYVAHVPWVKVANFVASEENKGDV